MEKGPSSLEESRSTFDPLAGVSMLVDGEMVFDEDEDDPSYPTPPFRNRSRQLAERETSINSESFGYPGSNVS